MASAEKGNLGDTVGRFGVRYGILQVHLVLASGLRVCKELTPMWMVPSSTRSTDWPQRLTRPTTRKTQLAAGSLLSEQHGVSDADIHATWIRPGHTHFHECAFSRQNPAKRVYMALPEGQTSFVPDLLAVDLDAAGNESSIPVGEIRPAYADEKRVLARTRLAIVTGVDVVVVARLLIDFGASLKSCTVS